MTYGKPIIALLFLTILPIFCNAQNFDIDLLRSINQNENNFKDAFYYAEAKSVYIVNAAVPVGMFLTGLINNDKKLQKDAAYVAGTWLFSAVVTHSLKRIVKRERPFNSYANIHKRDAGGGYGFPSGHTSAAFCTATSLSLYYPKWYVIAPAYLWAASVGYGRMYEGVHYPSDVLAGAVIGAGSAWLGYKMQRWMNRKKANRQTVTTVF